MAKKNKATTPRKPKDPTKPAAPKKSWSTKTLEALTRAGKNIGALVKRFEKAKPPGSWSENLTTMVTAYNALGDNVNTLAAADYKPTKAGKAAVGSKISVLPDKLGESIFTVIPAETYAGAEILGEDGRESWLVKCADGVTRTVRKKLVGSAG